MPTYEQKTQELYAHLEAAIKKIVCPHESMFENAAAFDIDDIRKQIDALLKSSDGTLILYVENMPHESHEQALIGMHKLGLTTSIAVRNFIYLSYNADGQLTRISARHCPNENERSAFSFDLIAAERRVNHIRRYCPVAPTVDEARDALILDNISRLSAFLVSHVNLVDARLFDIAAFDELLYQWCARYGQYQFLDMKIEKTPDNEVDFIFYIQNPKTFNSDLLIEQFKDGVLIESDNIESNCYTVQLKIDPASLPAQCKIIHLNDEARDIISVSQVAGIPPQDKSLYKIERYIIKEMQNKSTVGNVSLNKIACGFFVATAASVAAMVYAGTPWRNSNN